MNLLIDNNTGTYVDYNFLEQNKDNLYYLYVPLDEPCTRSTEFAKHLHTQIVSDLDCLNDNSDFFEQIKKSFNPLLKVQNYIIFDINKKAKYELPYYYLPFIGDNCPIENIVQLINDKTKISFFQCLLSYAITKDLLFIKKSLDYPIDCDTEYKLITLRNIAELVALHSKNLDTKEIEQKILNSLTMPITKPVYKTFYDLIPITQNKNLVLIHLESISSLIYSTNKHIFKNISKFSEKCLAFSHYYSSATSTLMALSSIFYGNSYEPDYATSYEEVCLNTTYNKNLFAMLSEKGYATKSFTYTSRYVTDEIRYAKIWNDGKTTYKHCFVYDEFIGGIEKFFEDNKNEKFAVFIDNEISHSGITTDDIKITNGYEDKMDRAYKNIDDMVESIYIQLEKNNLLDNTLIVLYGDHGDDKWTRCMNYGFSHVIVPYMNTIHTPLFIFDTNISPACFDSLVSAVDLKSVILYLLGIENEDSFKYSGKNVLKHKNDYIYSSNLFANQVYQEKISSNQMAKLNNFSHIEYKNKGFGIADDKYYFLVSKDGMSLFSTKSDPLNYSNLLNFYEINEDGTALKFKNYGAWRGHFRIELMEDWQVYECLLHYYDLRAKLIEHIKTRNQLVIEKHIKDLHLFDFSNFNKITPRGFIY